MAGVQGGLIGRLSRRFGEARLVAAGALALGGALVLFASTSQLALLVVSLAFLGFGMGLTHPSLQSLASRGAAPGRQGATMGVYQSAGSLARILGPRGRLPVRRPRPSGPVPGRRGALAAGLRRRGPRGMPPDFLREATQTFRQGGFQGTLQRYGWKLFAGFFLFYLVRDVTLYIVLPYLAARGVLSLWR